MFNRTGDLGLQPPSGYFQHSVPNNLMMPEKDGYRSSMEVDDPMGRFTHHNYSLASSSSLSMDPLISYVNPNAVLPVSYPVRFPDTSADHHVSTGDTTGKSDM